MIRNLKDLIGYTVRATDGDIGRVYDFHFDDKQWAIRYLVMDLADLGASRRVLLSPLTLGQADDEAQVLPVALTMEQVRGSPDIAADQPVSRQQEIELHDYYGWPFYWDMTSLSGLGPGNLLAAYPLIESESAAQASQDEQAGASPPMPSKDSYLHSAEKVFGYSIQARDGDIGKLEDFIVDDQDWRILYMVVDTGGWLTGRSVLVAPAWVKEVSWPERRVVVDLKRQTIQDSPEYEGVYPLDADYQARLTEYYNQNR
ncbi:MAG TPA: PRC-barrel domain-containing protein [Anaerolineales bacterium]